MPDDLTDTSEDSLAATAAAVRRLEDREAIRRLVHDYGVALDDRDFAGLEQLFTPDAAMLAPGGRVEGREAVLAVFRERLAAYTLTYHVAHTHGIDLDGDEARGVVTGSAQLVIDGQTYQVALRYHDRYCRAGTRDEMPVWQFAERRQAVFYVLPFDELGRGAGLDEPIRWPGVAPRASDVVRLE